MGRKKEPIILRTIRQNLFRAFACIVIGIPMDAGCVSSRPPADFLFGKFLLQPQLDIAE
jgi:cation transport ATPase